MNTRYASPTEGIAFVALAICVVTLIALLEGLLEVL